MSANHEQSNNDAPETEDVSPPVVSIIILSNSDSQARQIELAVRGSARGEVFVRIESMKSRLIPVDHDHTEIIILDAQDLDMDPLHELKRVHGLAPMNPIILLYSTPDAYVASRALRAGATAFLASREVTTQLSRAIEKATSHGQFVSEEVMQGILHGMTENPDSDARIPIEVLSDREMMVFQLLGKGKCPRNIADELGVNIKTIATHCNNIRRKLHTPDFRHLTRMSLDWTAGRSPHISSGSTHHHR